QLGAADVLARGVRQDGEVLRDERVLLDAAQLLDPGQRLAGRLAQPLLVAGGQVGDAIVQARLADAGGLLRREARLDGEEDLRILVAASDPGSVGGRRAWRRGGACLRRSRGRRGRRLRVVAGGERKEGGGASGRVSHRSVLV